MSKKRNAQHWYGFASLVRDGSREFDIRVSIEKDPVAHRTLSLRALFRSFPVGKIPESYYQYIRGEINRQQMENDPVVRPYLEKANNEAIHLFLLATGA